MESISRIFSIKINITQNRILYLDYIRGLLILAVLYHHASAPLNQYVLQFHMPALFLLSGYTEAVLHKETTFGHYVKSKFFRLIVPYLGFETLNFLLFVIFRKPFENGEFSLTDVFISIFTCTNNAYMGLYGRLWFLPAIFVSSIFAYLIKHYLSKYKPIILCWCLVLFTLSYISSYKIPLRLPFTIDTAFLGTAFLLLGYIAAPILTHFFERTKMRYSIILLVAFSAIFIFINKISNPLCHMFTNSYNDYPFMVICALSGTMVFFIVVKICIPLIEKISISKDYIKWYSINSLIIFPVHLSVKVFSIPLLEHLHINHWSALLVIMLLLSIPISNIINNYCPMLMGRFSKNKKAR